MKQDEFEKIREQLLRNAAGKPGPAVLAIDGRCAAGKSTLGMKLAEAWDAPLFHMDDFYLQAHQRTEERLAEPGGNVDRERFLQEVLLPLRRGEPVLYRPFDCHSMDFRKAQQIAVKDIAIVEGSYACHPDLRDLYDLRIFMDIDPETQRERLLRRNGPEGLQRFIERWIPLEERYFESCAVRDCCEILDKNQEL